jgi:hypothetical protein
MKGVVQRKDREKKRSYMYDKIWKEEEEHGKHFC